MNEIDLTGSKILIKQRYELAEFVGFETRNKYEIQNSSGAVLGFAAEQQKGILGFIFRQLLGHWRTFEVHFFNLNRSLAFTCLHPFRFFFQRFEVYDSKGILVGALQQRFSIFTKRFDIEDQRGQIIFEMSSPLFKIWTFPIRKGLTDYAIIRKKWSGLFAEAVADKDNFEIDFIHPNIDPQHKQIFLASAIFIDLQYFEKKSK